MKVATELDVTQGSDEWLKARLGLVTSSEIHNILAKNKNGTWAASRKRYLTQLVLERMTGKTPSRFVTKSMEWGSETEDLARTEYMLRTGNATRTCGIFLHDDYKIGDSPDFLIEGQRGCGEIKCYDSANHLEALRMGKMPPLHTPQVQNHIYMTDSDFCDYESFDPDFPENAQIFIQRIPRDDKYIKWMIIEILIFLDEVDETVKFLKKYKG